MPIGYYATPEAHAALKQHLDFAVVSIADKARQLIAAGDFSCREAKTDTLNAPAEKYMFCDISH